MKINESQLINIVKRVINENKDRETEYSVEREHVCVKGECYSRKHTDVPCGGNGDGNGGRCFKSGRKCRDGC